MKTDWSFVLYDKYFKLENRTIEIKMKNQSIIIGKFHGFFRGHKTYIIKWHLVNADIFLGIDAFGFLLGQIINHKDISKITFLEDNSIMNFEQNLI